VSGGDERVLASVGLAAVADRLMGGQPQRCGACVGTTGLRGGVGAMRGLSRGGMR
jgi:hypothetical protein